MRLACWNAGATISRTRKREVNIVCEYPEDVHVSARVNVVIMYCTSRWMQFRACSWSTTILFLQFGSRRTASPYPWHAINQTLHHGENSRPSTRMVSFTIIVSFKSQYNRSGILCLRVKEVRSAGRLGVTGTYKEHWQPWLVDLPVVSRDYPCHYILVLTIWSAASNEGQHWQQNL